MNEKLKRLKNWAEGNKSKPYRLEIHPTNRCNLKCRMCGTRASWREEEKSMDQIIKENRSREMDDSRLLQLIQEASKIDVKRVLLTGGGEPFVRKDLVLQMMRDIKKNDIFGNINTNGALLGEEDISGIIDIGWDLIMFSLDAPRAETHDYIRNKEGTFNKAAKNILRFKELKEKEGTDKPEVVLNTVLTERNYRQMPELVEFAKEAECNDLTLIPLIDSDKYPELKIKDNKKVSKHLKKAQEIANERNLHTNIEDVLSKYEKEKEENKGQENRDNKHESNFSEIPCFEPFLNMVVRMDGTTNPCCMIESGGENLKEKNLKEIWNSEYFKHLREKFRQEGYPEVCSECILSKETRNQDFRRELKEIL